MEPAIDTVHPPLFRRHARRPRLTHLLDESRAQAILITAPAGYGKTTLAREWLQGREDAVWYRATSASADVAAFSAGVSEVIEPLVPGAGERLKQRLRVADTPERAARPLAELLAEDISDWPEGGLLVIDDYHLVADSAPVEDFFDWLLTLAHRLRVLVTSRRRPRWASARRILYGEITEIGRDQLAMNAEEAGRVLEDRSRESVRALVAQAEGWPALIGLAALTAAREIPEERVSEALYRYFAEEVVRGEAREVERFMLLASLPSGVDARIAREVLGVEDPEPTLEWLVAEGVLHPAGDQFRFHPLLRTFLRRKLETEDPDLYGQLVDAAIADARDGQRWEQAFELANETRRLEVAVEVLEHAAAELLAAGRIETLERWLRVCWPAAAHHPGALLTQAEVLMRQGRFGEASAVAEDVAQTLQPNDPVASHAFYTAGQARYLRSQSEPAAAFYERAIDLATEIDDRRNALWGAFLSQLDLDVSVAANHLDELDRLSTGDLDTRLRAVTGRQALASHCGTLAGIWTLVEPMAALAQYATDPLIKSNVLAQTAYLAIARADYERALRLVDPALTISTNLKHDFATGSCLAYRAAALIGLRKLEAAKRDIRDLSSIRARQEDPYLQTQYILVRVRLAIAKSDLRSASKLVSDFPRDLPDRATRGEHLGLASIVWASLGEEDRAHECAASGAEITAALEARTYSLFGRGIIGLQSRPPNPTKALEAVSSAAEADFFDAIVTAYRAFPALLGAISEREDLRRIIEPIALRAQDRQLARRAGLRITVQSTAQAKALLTRREAEVLNLVGQGLSNGEIARRLFISESTAKVHVHHILDKLGAKTRLQAALMAKEQDV